jgi:hypothetical protein
LVSVVFFGSLRLNPIWSSIPSTNPSGITARQRGTVVPMDIHPHVLH